MQNTIPPQPPEQTQEDVAKVLFASKVRLTSANWYIVYYVCLQDWRAEFPLGEWVSVKDDEEDHVINGCLRTLVYNKVRKVLHYC